MECRAVRILYLCAEIMCVCVCIMVKMMVICQWTRVQCECIPSAVRNLSQRASISGWTRAHSHAAHYGRCENPMLHNGSNQTRVLFGTCPAQKSSTTRSRAFPHRLCRRMRSSVESVCVCGVCAYRRRRAAIEADCHGE